MLKNRTKKQLNKILDNYGSDKLFDSLTLSAESKSLGAKNYKTSKESYETKLSFFVLGKSLLVFLPVLLLTMLPFFFLDKIFLIIPFIISHSTLIYCLIKNYKKINKKYNDKLYGTDCLYYLLENENELEILNYIKTKTFDDYNKLIKKNDLSKINKFKKYNEQTLKKFNNTNIEETKSYKLNKTDTFVLKQYKNIIIKTDNEINEKTF